MRREMALGKKTRVVITDGAVDDITVGLHSGTAYAVIVHLTPDEADALADALREVAANVRV